MRHTTLDVINRFKRLPDCTYFVVVGLPSGESANIEVSKEDYNRLWTKQERNEARKKVKA